MLTHAHCHTESSAHHGYDGNQQSLAGGPPLTGSASDRSFFCPHVLFSALLLHSWRQRKMRRIQGCLAGMSGFSVIPGVLPGGGGIRHTGPPSGIAGHL